MLSSYKSAICSSFISLLEDFNVSEFVPVISSTAYKPSSVSTTNTFPKSLTNFLAASSLNLTVGVDAVSELAKTTSSSDKSIVNNAFPGSVPDN